MEWQIVIASDPGRFTDDFDVRLFDGRQVEDRFGVWLDRDHADGHRRKDSAPTAV